jgi:hypothetical protein
MASGVYNQFKGELMKGTYDLDGADHTVKVALLNNSHSFNTDHDGWSAVSANEVSGTGYTAGGQALANKTVTVDDTDDEGVFDADNVTWGSSTITAYHAVIYDDTPTSPADPLIASIDFGGAQTSTSGNFTIAWAAEGIININ